MINFTRKPRYGYEDLLEIIRLLRSPEGCPWDRVQTHQSIRRGMLEEAYEAAEAIDSGDTALLREELGDVLMQVVFHADIEKDAGHFTMDDVCDGVVKKLLFRHPHVFGGGQAETAETVPVSWEALKRQEKGQQTTGDALDAVARSLPGLWRAEKIQKKAADAGFDWRDVSDALDKLDEETAELTDVMAHSGVMVDLSPIPGIKVDKHSTGGVGDKTTLVIAPIVAACGVKIAKMSGRGLGHTGGTIDKMESVPGTRTALSQEEFFAQVNRIGLSVIGQSEGIAVADKKMYALRDVTATVSCIPLIASSIMSKKLASGSDAILLDVTTGTGAFMKTVDQSIELAKLMVSIGTHHGRRVAAMITDMDTPLGHNIGNSLEVMESMDVLKGHGPADLTEVCLQLAANMLVLADKGSPAECRAMAEAVIADGSAYAKCKEMFAAQGGDTRVLDDYSLFEKPAASYELLAEEDGYIVANDAEKIGSASVLLGAGRQKKGDPLDFAAGITLHKKRGDYVHKGESLATFYGATDKFDAAAAEYRSGLVYGPEKPEEAPLVYALVTKDGVERY